MGKMREGEVTRGKGGREELNGETKWERRGREK